LKIIQFLLAPILALSIGVSIPVLSNSEQSVRPGINKHYQKPIFKQWLRRFESPGREVYDKRTEIVDSLQLKPGTQIADIGAGTGLFTHLFAAKVGRGGKVYAVDISKEFIRNIKIASQSKGFDNIVTIVNTPYKTGLKKNSIDIAFVCNTYHHFEYPKSMMTSIYTALKPGGVLIIIDFRKQKGLRSNWVMSHVRANREVVIKEVSKWGFRLKEKKHFLKTNYYLKFKKI